MPSLFTQLPDWTPPASLKQLPAGASVALDTETKDEGLARGIGPGWAWGGGKVVGVSLAWRPAPGQPPEAVYLPVAHEGGGNLDPGLVFRYVFAHLARPDLRWKLANSLYDFGWLATEGERRNKTVWPSGQFRDVQILGPLLNEYRPSYSLDNLGKIYLGAGKDETEMTALAQDLGIAKNKVKENLWRLPAAAVGRYAEVDALRTLELAEVMEAQADKEDLGQAVELEHDLIRVLYRMRKRGVLINLGRVQELARTYLQREKEAIAEVRRISGVTIDAMNAGQIAQALAAEGIQAPRTAKGQPSVTKELLAEWIKGGSKVATAVRIVRKWNKARTTFLEGHYLGHAVQHGEVWRIHPEFNALRAEREGGGSFGTVSYRFSSTGPNLQQLPGPKGDGDILDELAADIRGCCEPDEGEWIAADYSQQEPRLAIHYAAAVGMPKVRGGEVAARRVREDPKWDFHDFASSLTGVPRKRVKGISLGRMYGSGAGKIADTLGLSWEWATFEKNGRKHTYMKPGPEAAEIIAKYDAELPWVKDMADHCEKVARERGFIKLLGGHKARFSDMGGVHGDQPRKAFNRLCQGSGGGQIKRAMIDADAEGVPLLVTVHDENGTFGGPRERDTLVRCMREAYADRLRVPFKVDADCGTTWGDAAS